MKEIITKNRSLLEETERLLNDQIKLEGVSSAIYRSMASWAEIWYLRASFRLLIRS